MIKWMSTVSRRFARVDRKGRSAVTSRLATLGMEEAIFLIFCDWLGVSKTVITFLSQVVIFIANYILSKVFVFKNKENDTAEQHND